MFIESCRMRYCEVKYEVLEVLFFAGASAGALKAPANSVMSNLLIMSITFLDWTLPLNLLIF